MRLIVLSHKACWRSPRFGGGFATDGGFPLQMGSLASAFGELRVLVPVAPSGPASGELPLASPGLEVVPLRPVPSAGVFRKLGFPLWVLANLRLILREIFSADAVHAPIPGDVGTVGMLLAWMLRKPLLVRHCGNWMKPRTLAERFWRWFMEQTAGGRNVMLATGGAATPPSPVNPEVRWIFSTSLSLAELSTVAVRRKAPTGPLRLIFVARQETPKGGGVVLSALSLLKPRYPGIHLDIVGDGSALPRFRSMASELGLDKDATFHGKLDHGQVMALLHQAHLFCYPTAASEGFPKVVIEALATGLPVLATPVSVLPQLLGEGGGQLLPDATPESLANAVESVIRDPARYEAMSAAAVATAAGRSLEAWGAEIRRLCSIAWRIRA